MAIKILSITHLPTRTPVEVAARERARSEAGLHSMNVFADKTTTTTTTQAQVSQAPPEYVRVGNKALSELATSSKVSVVRPNNSERFTNVASSVKTSPSIELFRQAEMYRQTTTAPKISPIIRPNKSKKLTTVASFVKTSPREVLISQGEQFRREEKISAFGDRVEKIEQFERGMARRQKKFESVTGEVTGITSKKYWPSTARKVIAGASSFIPVMAEGSYLAGMKIGAAIEGYSFKGGSKRVSSELVSNIPKTGQAMAIAFDPRTPEGMANILLVAGGTYIGGRARVQTRTFTAKLGSFKTTSIKTTPTTTSTRGSYINLRGEKITFGTKAVQSASTGKGTIQSTYSRGGKVLAKTTKGIKSNTVVTDKAFSTETKVYPLDPVRRFLIESGTTEKSFGKVFVSNFESATLRKGITRNVFSQEVIGRRNVGGLKSNFKTKSNVKQFIDAKGKTISFSESGIKSVEAFKPTLKSRIGTAIELAVEKSISGKQLFSTDVISTSASLIGDFTSSFSRGSVRATFKPSTSFGAKPSVRPVISSRVGLLSVPSAPSIVRPVIITGGRADLVGGRADLDGGMVDTISAFTPKSDFVPDTVPDTVPLTTSTSIFTNEFSVPSSSFSTIFSTVSTTHKITPPSPVPVGFPPFLFPRVSFGGVGLNVGVGNNKILKGKREFTPTFSAANLGLKPSKTAYRSGLTLRGKK